jgi:hypothetical protein
MPSAASGASLLPSDIAHNTQALHYDYNYNAGDLRAGDTLLSRINHRLLYLSPKSLMVKQSELLIEVDVFIITPTSLLFGRRGQWE